MRKNDFDSRLIVYRSRKIALMLLIIILWVVFATSINQAQKIDKSWVALILPLTGLGLLLLPFPSTEEWEYRPWQTKARRNEQIHTRQ